MDSRNHSSKRIIALVAIVATVFLMLLSSFYITEHVLHHCDDEEHCPVCAMLLQCERSLKTIGTGIVMAVAAFIVFDLIADAFMGYSYESTQTTLISKKVRLDS